jgi:hypothetical protein
LCVQNCTVTGFTNTTNMGDELDACLIGGVYKHRIAQIHINACTRYYNLLVKLATTNTVQARSIPGTVHSKRIEGIVRDVPHVRMTL